MMARPESYVEYTDAGATSGTIGAADCFVLKRSEEQLEACSGSELIIPVRGNLHDLGS
jgi:hypothetical protein